MSGHPSATMDFLSKVVNSLVLFGGLAYVLRKPLKAMLAKRTLSWFSSKVKSFKNLS